MMWLGCLVDELGREAEAAALLAEAVYQARSAIPDEFNWQRDQLPWGHIANRAIHRAWYNLARLRARRGHTNEAIELWEDLLRMWPNDNIGARIGLMNHLVANGRYAHAVALAQRDRTDDTPEIRLGEAIARVHRGEEELAITAAERAIRTRSGRRLAERLIAGCDAMDPDDDDKDGYYDAVRTAWEINRGGILRAVLEELLEETKS